MRSLVYVHLHLQCRCNPFGLSNPPPPFSQVDTRTDALMQDTIRHHFARSTVIVIAHRLSTLGHMDRIIKLDQGTVVQEGPPSAFVELQS
jgi:ABC-type multidrug transport system fused ATPase/permease subunit